MVSQYLKNHGNGVLFIFGFNTGDIRNNFFDKIQGLEPQLQNIYCALGEYIYKYEYTQISN